MIRSLLSRMAIFSFGTVYPAYFSFKTVCMKSVDEYQIWMMYWIVFAAFSALEIFTDIFLSWFPYYYELKVFLILWLLPTVGNGCPIIFSKFLSPVLLTYERHIDYTLMRLGEKAQDVLFSSVIAAVMKTGRTVLDILHKNVPTDLVDTVVNYEQIGVRTTQQGGLVIQELEDSESSATSISKPKNAAKKLEKTAQESVIPTLKTRSRKGRPAKPEPDTDAILTENLD